MTLQQINYFCAICEEMHYTKAANKIHVSQPSLSYAIKELEQELGVKVFKRRGKHVELTECGEIFYQYAQRALECLNEGIQAVETKKNEDQKQINIGYLFSICVDFLAPLINEYFGYIGRCDQLMNFLPCKQPQVVEALQRGRFDIAFVTDDIQSRLINTSIEMIPVCQQEMFIVVRKDHPLAQKSSVLFSEIKNENFVAINPGKGLRIHMDQYFQKMNAQPRIVFAVDDSETLLSYVEAGLGIAIMSRLPTMSLEKIALLPVSDSPIRRNIVLLVNKRRNYSGDTRCLIEFVRTKKYKLQ